MAAMRKAMRHIRGITITMTRQSLPSTLLAAVCQKEVLFVWDVLAHIHNVPGPIVGYDRAKQRQHSSQTSVMSCVRVSTRFGENNF